MFIFVQINTFTLDPSFIGLITTGKLNFFLIKFISFIFDKSNEYLKYLGVKILFFINIFFDIYLSIAIEEAIIPECVYGIPIFSKIDWI